MNNSHTNDIWLALLAIFAGFLYVLKSYEDMSALTRGAKIRKILTGMGGSALTTWTVFEILFYFSLPERLCLALAGACGYLGAEVISKLVLQFIENKINKSN